MNDTPQRSYGTLSESQWSALHALTLALTVQRVAGLAGLSDSTILRALSKLPLQHGSRLAILDLLAKQAP